MQDKLVFQKFNEELLLDAQRLVANHLPTRDVLEYSLISKDKFTIFGPSLNSKIRKLLHLGTRGQYDFVDAMLKNDIELIFAKGTVTDSAGRIFQDISLFEYCLWALDMPMWTLLLGCIPQNETGKIIVEQCLAQYKNLKANGVEYCLEGQCITEPHFDFKNTIIKELQEYVDLVNQPIVDWNKAEEKWRKDVGGAQKRFPMHVVDEYCSDRPFNPVPDFTQQPTPSTKQVYNWATGAGKKEHWFATDSKLGIDFAIVKGNVRGGLGHVGGTLRVCGHVSRCSI
ncbi:TPA: F-box protein [Legionella anisa]